MSNPEPIEEHLLGFDAREMLATAASWTVERRQSLLLANVRKPLSADSLAWLSLYEEGAGIPRPGLPNLQPPTWRGPNASLWDDLGRLERDLATAHVRIPYWLVAFTWLADKASLSDPRSYGPFVEPVTPEEQSPDWLFLGFDVGDGSLLSGLMNCGYEDAERVALAKQWAPRLNEHHLFLDSEAALAFRLEANRQVPSHAPFFVYGLWLIRKVGTG